MQGLLADCRHAFRLYRRTPGSSLIAVGVLAIGMAFVVACLSLYVELALKPLAGIGSTKHFVTIAQVNGRQSSTLPFRFLERIAEDISGVEAALGVNRTVVPVVGGAERTVLEYASNGFFDLLRPRLGLGRGFETFEHAADATPVVVISDRLWREHFGGRPDVVGESIELVLSQTEAGPETGSFRVIGVMSPQMRGVLANDVDLWTPLEQVTESLLGLAASEQSKVHVHTLVRVRPGVSAKALLNEIDARYPAAAEDFALAPDFRIDTMDGVVRDIHQQRESLRQLHLFLLCSLLLALVAAANVSLFLLARAPGRQRELAIRLSVGARAGRLARQLASESVALVLVAAALGLLGSVWLVTVLRGTAVLQRADWSDLSLLDWRLLGLVVGLVLILAVIVSWAPIAGLKRLGLAASGRRIAARATLAQRIAGTAQIAIAGCLGGAAVAFVWYLGSLMLGDPGYELKERYSVLFMHRSMFGGSGGFATRAIDAARNRELIESLPGVQDVTFSFLLPGQSLLENRRVRDPVDPAREITILYSRIDGRFVEILGLRLLHGRAPSDNENGVSLVNQAMARLLFGRDDVVGETLDMGPVAPGGGSPDFARQTTIVGVLENLPLSEPTAEAKPALFTSLPPPPLNLQRAIVVSSLTGGDLQLRLQALFDEGAIDLSPNVVQSLREIRRSSLAPDTARGLMTIGAASLVVALAALGFYGTQRYLVAAGRREYAIRASLGAGPRSLGRIVVGRGLLLGLPGLVTGSLLAFMLVAWLRDEYLSRTVSPGYVAAAVAAGLTLLVLAASLGPAREARRTEPAPLLRED